MSEVDPVAVDRDYALGFARSRAARSIGRRRWPWHLTPALHRWRRHARRGEQRIMDVRIEAVDPGPHDVGQCAGQHVSTPGSSFGDRARQFDCIEGVSAGYLVYPAHRRTRRTVAAVVSKLPHVDHEYPMGSTDPARGIGPRQLHPSAADAVAIGSHTAENANVPGESPCGERDHIHARRVDPLQVVDRHQKRPSSVRYSTTDRNAAATAR